MKAYSRFCVSINWYLKNLCLFPKTYITNQKPSLNIYIQCILLFCRFNDFYRSSRRADGYSVGMQRRLLITHPAFALNTKHIRTKIQNNYIYTYIPDQICGGEKFSQRILYQRKVCGLLSNTAGCACCKGWLWSQIILCMHIKLIKVPKFLLRLSVLYAYKHASSVRCGLSYARLWWWGDQMDILPIEKRRVAAELTAANQTQRI